MADLWFYWGVMTSGKSTALLQTAHDYDNNGKNVLIAKPEQDLMAGYAVSSRMNETLKRTCDFIITRDGDLFNFIEDKHKENCIDLILVDEAQFLSPRNVIELSEAVALLGIDIKCYGLKSDYRGEPFEGASWLFSRATIIESINTSAICRISDIPTSADCNLQLVDGEPNFSGSQVHIRGSDSRIEYQPVSLSIWVRLFKDYQKNKEKKD